MSRSLFGFKKPPGYFGWWGKDNHPTPRPRTEQLLELVDSLPEDYKVHNERGRQAVFIGMPVRYPKSKRRVWVQLEYSKLNRENQITVGDGEELMDFLAYTDLWPKTRPRWKTFKLLLQAEGFRCGKLARIWRLYTIEELSTLNSLIRALELNATTQIRLINETHKAILINGIAA